MSLALKAFVLAASINPVGDDNLHQAQFMSEMTAEPVITEAAATSSPKIYASPETLDSYSPELKDKMLELAGMDIFLVRPSDIEAVIGGSEEFNALFERLPHDTIPDMGLISEVNTLFDKVRENAGLTKDYKAGESFGMDMNFAFGRLEVNLLKASRREFNPAATGMNIDSPFDTSQVNNFCIVTLPEDPGTDRIMELFANRPAEFLENFVWDETPYEIIAKHEASHCADANFVETMTNPLHESLAGEIIADGIALADSSPLTRDNFIDLRTLGLFGRIDIDHATSVALLEEGHDARQIQKASLSIVEALRDYTRENNPELSEDQISEVLINNPNAMHAGLEALHSEQAFPVDSIEGKTIDLYMKAVEEHIPDLISGAPVPALETISILGPVTGTKP